MSETPTPPNTDETPAPPAADAQADSTDWKAEARKWEARAKADFDAAKAWRDYEVSQKTEHEKLAEELARVKSEADKSNAELLRFKIASEKGITGDATKLLRGTTEEELNQEAELLLSLIAEQSKPKGPKPDENQGKPAAPVVEQLTQADLKEMSNEDILKARTEGRLDKLLGKI
jgi:hypothetical protein